MALNSQEQALDSRTAGGRVFVLDALRGLAAFTVILHHFHYAVAAPQSHRWYIRAITAGHEAVLLFFVLSGYVLSLPYWRRRELPYGRYIVRRITRIYLPYAAAVLLSAAVGRHFLYSRLPLNAWFYIIWQTPITWRVLRDGLLLWPFSTLNVAFWSLWYEMEMSVVFPLVCRLVNALGTSGTLIFVALAHTSAVELERHDANPYFIAQTMRFGSFFVLGALAAKDQQRLTGWWKQLGTPLKVAFLLLSFGLYQRFFGWLHGIYAKRLGLSDNADIFRSDLVIVAGALGLLLAATSSQRIQRFLDEPGFEYLGRVSYSMYLIHSIVLFSMFNLLYGKVPIGMLVPIFIAATLLLSHLFLVLIEEPSLQLGKRLTERRRSPTHQP